MKQILTDLVSIMGRLGEFKHLPVGSVLVIALHRIALILVSVVSVWIATRLVLEDHPQLFLPFLVFFFLAIVHALCYLYGAQRSHQPAYRIFACVRIDLYAAIQRITPRDLSGRRTGDSTTTTMNDMEQLEWFYAHITPIAAAVLVNTIVIKSALTTLVGPLVLLILISMVLPILIPWSFVPIQRKQGERVRASLSSLKSFDLDLVIGAQGFYTLERRKKHTRQVLEMSVLVQRDKLVQVTHEGTGSAEFAFGATAVSIATLAVLTGRVIEGTYPAQFLLVAIVFIGMATPSVLSLAGMLGTMSEISFYAHRINEILDAPDPLPSTVLDLPFVKGERDAVVGESATYRYEDEAALKEAALSVPGNRAVALVGPSGAGESTFAHLLICFMDPDSGSAHFSGYDLRGIDPGEHGPEVILVPQNSHVFSGAFRSNPLLADWNADDTTVWKTLNAAGFEDLVKSLGGLDAPVGGRGTALSGGKRQRVVLARAFLRQLCLLIPDESPTNPGPGLERGITESTTRLRQGRTILVISHRLASFTDAESIWVLDSGRIVTHGSHKILKHDSVDCRRILTDQLDAES